MGACHTLPFWVRIFHTPLFSKARCAETCITLRAFCRPRGPRRVVAILLVANPRRPMCEPQQSSRRRCGDDSFVWRALRASLVRGCEKMATLEFTRDRKSMSVLCKDKDYSEARCHGGAPVVEGGFAAAAPSPRLHSAAYRSFPLGAGLAAGGVAARGARAPASARRLPSRVRRGASAFALSVVLGR